MKALAKILLAITAISLSGCYSYVKTYDKDGNLLSECDSGGMFLGFIPVWGVGSSCASGQSFELYPGPGSKSGGVAQNQTASAAGPADAKTTRS